MYCLVPYLHQDEFAQALDATDTGTHTTEYLQLTLVITQQTQVCSQVIWEWGCIYQGTYHMLSHIASSMKLCPEYPGNEAPFCSRFAGYILLQPPSPSVSQPSSPSFQPTTKLRFLSYTSQFSQTTSDIEGSNSLVPRPSRMAWVQGLSILQLRLLSVLLERRLPLLWLTASAQCCYEPVTFTSLYMQ